jgi:hypothetical protein
MDLTLIRDKHGYIIGAAHGHIAARPPSQPAAGNQAGPMAVAGQTFEHVTVSDEFAQFKGDPHSFGQRLKEHFPVKTHTSTALGLKRKKAKTR